MGLEDLHSGGRVIIMEKIIAILIECFVLGTIILILHVSLSLVPGARGVVEADNLFKEARSANAGECFPCAPAEYCPVFFRWFRKSKRHAICHPFYCLSVA